MQSLLSPITRLGDGSSLLPFRLLRALQQPACGLDVIPVDVLRVLLIQRDQAPEMDNMPMTAAWTDFRVSYPPSG